MRPTGMPVQSATTAATAWASTLGRISGVSPCSSASFVCSSLQLGEQLLAPRRQRAGARLSAVRLAAVAQLARAARGSGRPASCSSAQRCSSRASRSCLGRRASPRPRLRRAPIVDADRRLAVDDAELGLQRLDAPAASPPPRPAWRAGSPPRGRTRCRAGSPPCRAAGARGCSGARASRPLRALRRGAARGGASRASRRRRAASAAPSSSSGSSTCTTWKRRVSAGSFSMYFLYSAQVVAAIGAQRAARQRRLEQVGRIAGARPRRRRRSACAPRR